jgi:hypothetical protein
MPMETTVHEIADGIYRLSTFVPAADLPFNQYLVMAEEPMLFHAGNRQLFEPSARPWRRCCGRSGCAG